MVEPSCCFCSRYFSLIFAAKVGVEQKMLKRKKKDPTISRNQKILQIHQWKYRNTIVHLFISPMVSRILLLPLGPLKQGDVLVTLLISFQLSPQQEIMTGL